MDEENGFIPNLASMLEVSLVEDVDSVLSVEPTKMSNEAKSDIVSMNGVVPSDVESCTEEKVTNVHCPLDGEQNELHNKPLELLPSGQDVDGEAKQLFYSTFKDTKMVMNLRLHCTVCDCHIGCTPAAEFTMAFHKVLRVLICKECENFYGNGDFVCGDDGSETFCRWCGQGGRLYCCSICPNVFCKKCIRRNLGSRAVKVIEVSNDWICYQCNLHPLREHRALCWGLRTFLSEQSKDEKKVQEDEAERSPGFNPLMCCQGEKLPYYRPSQPLRPVIYPTVRQTLKVKDVKTLTLPTNEMSLLHNTLTSGGRVTFTAPSTVPKTSSDNASVPLNASSQHAGVVIGQASVPGKHFIPDKSPTLNNVSNAAVKFPAPKATVEPGVSSRNSAVYVLQKWPQHTYENAFLSHLAKTGVQSGTVHRSQMPVQNTAVTVTSHVEDSTLANLEASIPLTYIRTPLRTVLLSPTPSFVAGSTVNNVFVNQNLNPGSVLCTTSPSHMGAAPHLQQNAFVPVPTTCCTVRSDDSTKLVPQSTLCNTLDPTSGPDQLPYPTDPKNLINDSAIESRTAAVSVKDGDGGGGDDDDIVEIFNSVQDSNVQKVECKQMMEIFRQVGFTLRIFLYHADLLRQKFGNERSANGTSHIIGKFYRLLKKVLVVLNAQKDCVSKEFIEWLNAEKAKHGILTSEGGQNSSLTEDKSSDAELSQEPEVPLDMEITCESDNEDVTNPITEVQQDLMGCNENLSDNDSDSDDPFRDCESTEQEKVIPVLKPILSYTVREVLSSKYTRIPLLQLLTELDSKTANIKRKITDTEVLTGGTSASCSELSLHSSEHGRDLSTEEENSVTTQTIDSNGVALQGSQMENFSSGTEGKAGHESERSRSPCKDSLAKSVDVNIEDVQDTQMENSSSGIEGKAGHESERSRSSCEDSLAKSLDMNSVFVQDSQMESSSSGTEGKAGIEESERSRSPCKSSVTSSIDANSFVAHGSLVENSLINTESKAINDECDKNNPKYQATKRKYPYLSSTVMSSDREAKRYCTRRNSVMIGGDLQGTNIPVSNCRALISSAMKNGLIKPCFVSVARLKSAI